MRKIKNISNFIPKQFVKTPINEVNEVKFVGVASWLLLRLFCFCELGRNEVVQAFVIKKMNNE